MINLKGPKFEFTPEQIQYIVANWGKESPYSMKNKFGCTWYAVCKVAEEKGLKVPTSNAWTDEEVAKLITLSNKYHYLEIAKKLHKTEAAVYIKAKRLGITLIQDRRKWTPDEEQVLSEQWGYKSIETIAKQLKRSVFSLKVKAVRMQLGPMINNNDLMTVSDISDILNVSRERIINRWSKIGLNLKNKKMTQNMSIYVVTWDDLLLFLKENPNEWDSRKVEKNMLGCEEDWLIAKRKSDKIVNPLWYRRWTEEEIKTAVSLLATGKSYEEIGKKLDRSASAIANLLRNMGYSYQAKQFWHGKELQYLRENYQDMKYKDIAQKLGRSQKAVGTKLEELGYQKKLKKN